MLDNNEQNMANMINMLQFSVQWCNCIWPRFLHNNNSVFLSVVEMSGCCNHTTQSWSVMFTCKISCIENLSLGRNLYTSLLQRHLMVIIFVTNTLVTDPDDWDHWCVKPPRNHFNRHRQLAEWVINRWGLINLHLHNTLQSSVMRPAETIQDRSVLRIPSQNISSTCLLP